MIKNFFNVAGADAVKRIAEWIRTKFYTKTEIDDMLSAGMKYEVVNELPATGEAGTVYLVPKQTAGTGDVYDEYIYVDGSFEHIGSTEIDLSNYYTKTEADNLLDDKVDKESGKGLSTNDFTTAEKTKLSNIEAGAEVNVQSDWNQSDNTKDDYIKNKPTLRQPNADGTAGQYLKSNGNGNAPSWETMDSSPTDNSTKAVTSGGVKTALDGKQASVTITTNANTPTDNDTVIMQDSGNTGTTSFLRRKLSTLWEYFKKKPYGEAYLVWGGKNQNANLSPIDANLISEARANRLARYPLEYMKIEDSRDDGVTWTENTSITDSAKHILVTDCAGNASNIRIGGSDANHVADEHCKTRITFTTYGVSSSILYARIEKICLWIATGGTTGNTCTILGRLQTDVEADNDVWATLGGPATLGGWSDWNVIQTDFTTYGNQKATQYGQFRLLFECTGRGSSSTDMGLTIQKIRAYGMRCWMGNNPLALYNSFFAIDPSDNASFPANVTAAKHITNGGTTNQMVAGNGDLKDITETCKTATSLNGGKYGFRIIKIGGEDYTYLIVLADVTGVYDGTINNKLYGIQGHIFMQRDGGTPYNNLVGRITATASYSSSFVRLYTDVVQSDVVKPCVIKKDGRWLLCLSARGNNGTYNATSIIFLGRTYELADEPFTKIRVDSTFTHYYDGGAEIDYIKQASRYPLWASFGGNNTQFVLGDGTLQNSPIPVSKGGTGATTAIGAEYNILNQVADSTASTLTGARKVALCNETKSASNGVFRWVTLQKIWDSHIPSFKYTSQEGFGVTIIADLTDSFTNQTWIECGINGIILGHRNGYGQGTIVQRITCWGNRSADTTYLYTDCVDDKAYKPLLLRYNSRYYLAIESTSASREVLFFGYKANLLDSLIKLYRANGKWYSDSAKTQEVSVEIVKSYSRYPNAYLNFGGTASQVVLGTGELKTIDSSVASGSSNLVTSGAVATAINGIDLSGKVNLQPDFTASQIDYSAGNVGKWQKVLRFPEGADLVINMKKTAMGSDATSTLWFSSSSMGDSYTSLFGNHSVRFVHDGGYVFLVLSCLKNSNMPLESYTFQIAHSSVPMSDIVAVTDASPITATPKEPNIVYRAPITTGAVSFNVNSSGAGSVYMSGHNDFLGNMTSEASNGVVVTMSGATEGQIYRFVFTRNITGGVTFKQSNVAYCTISGDVNAGDTITLTAVSNTADGWLYEQESAGIKSTDGSVNVEYDGGVADLSINIPPDVVRNNEWTSSVGHRVLAIGEGASADTASNNVAIGKDADASGNSATCVGGDSEASGTYGTAIGYGSVANAIGATAFGANAKADGYYSVAIGSTHTQSNARTTAKSYAVAVGAGSQATGDSSTAYGYTSKAENEYAVAIGSYTMAIGSRSIAIGRNSKGAFKSDNTTLPRYLVKRFQAIDFNEGGETKKYKFVDYGSSVTITLNDNSATLTPPNNNCKFFIVVNDSDADKTYRSVGTYAQINGADAYIPNIGGFDIKAVAISGNYYALWFYGIASYFPQNVESFSVLAYYASTDSGSYQIAIGCQAQAIYGDSIAIGCEAVSSKSGQMVLGAGSIPNETDMLIIGNGKTSANAKKNILTIDSNERLNVSAYVGGTQTIEMNQQTGSLSNITKSVYKIKWDGTGTIRLTLGTSGCVEGQRVSIAAVTNDVVIFGTTVLIPVGTFGDFLFLDGAWIPSSGVWYV